MLADVEKTSPCQHLKHQQHSLKKELITLKGTLNRASCHSFFCVTLNRFHCSQKGRGYVEDNRLSFRWFVFKGFRFFGAGFSSARSSGNGPMRQE